MRCIAAKIYSHSVVDHFPFYRETSSALWCPVYQLLVLIPASGTLFRKSFHVPVSSRKLSMLSSCSFRTPGFKFDPFGVGFWSGYRHESNNSPAPFVDHTAFSSVYTFVKYWMTEVCVLLFASSILSYWTTCLYSCLHHAAFIMTALYYHLKYGKVILPAYFFFYPVSFEVSY